MKIKPNASPITLAKGTAFALTAFLLRAGSKALNPTSTRPTPPQEFPTSLDEAWEWMPG